MRNYVIPLVILGVLLFTLIGACQLTPTLTVTPIPTPTVDPQDIVGLPQLELIVSTLSERYESFNIVTSWGLTPDTLVYVGFEAGGSLHMAIYAWEGGRWALVDVMDVDGVPQAKQN